MKKYVYKKAFISHLGAKAVDEKYQEELELSKTGIGIGLNFIIEKNILVLFLLSIWFTKLYKVLFKILIYFFLKEEFKYKIYYNRASGFYNSLLKELGIDQNLIKFNLNMKI